MMSNDKFDAYTAVQEAILKQLDEGTIPWHKPWNSRIESMRPSNAVSKKPYRGVNLWLLPPMPDNRWVTFNQAKQLGGNVKKGEKSTIVVFWKMMDGEVEIRGEVKERKIPLLRYYRVFNVDQCEGLKLKPLEKVETEGKEAEYIEVAERMIEAMPNRPTIKHGGSEAYYRPSNDMVVVPEITDFETPESYYSTQFHELTHSTGHESRLGRHKEDGCDMHFGSESYGKEELVAEFGAAYLSALVGFSMDGRFKQHAAYISGWSEVVKQDKKIVVQASSKAQKAVDYIVPEMPEEGENNEEEAE